MQGHEVFLCLKRLKYIRTVTLQSQDVTQGLQKISCLFQRIDWILRIYSNYQQIPRVLGGMGIVILSLY